MEMGWGKKLSFVVFTLEYVIAGKVSLPFVVVIFVAEQNSAYQKHRRNGASLSPTRLP